MALEDLSGGAASTEKAGDEWCAAVLRRGWRLGKKVAVAGAAITVAPVVVPPLLIASALGLAFAVPFTLYFAGFACTNIIMCSLLPLRFDEEGLEFKHEAEAPDPGNNEKLPSSDEIRPSSECDVKDENRLGIELPEEKKGTGAGDERYGEDIGGAEGEGSETEHLSLKDNGEEVSFEKVEVENLPSSARLSVVNREGDNGNPQKEDSGDGASIEEEGVEELPSITYLSVGKCETEIEPSLESGDNENSGNKENDDKGSVGKVEVEKLPSSACFSVVECAIEIEPHLQFGNQQIIDKDNEGSIKNVEVDELPSSACLSVTKCKIEIESSSEYGFDYGNRGELVVQEKLMESMVAKEGKDPSPNADSSVVLEAYNTNSLGVEMLEKEKSVGAVDTKQGEEMEHLSQKDNGDEESTEEVEIKKLPSDSQLFVAGRKFAEEPNMEYGEDDGNRGSISVVVEDKPTEKVGNGEGEEVEEKGKMEDHMDVITAEELPPNAHPIVLMPASEYETGTDPSSLKLEHAYILDQMRIGGGMKMPEEETMGEERVEDKREEGLDADAAAAPEGKGQPSLVAGKVEMCKIETEPAAVENNQNRESSEMMQPDRLTEELKQLGEDKKESNMATTAPRNVNPSTAVVPIEHESEVDSSSFSSEYASAIEDHSSYITDTDSKDSMELGLDTRSGPEMIAAALDDERAYDEENIWEQIYAIRTIVGCRATLHSSLVGELRALYLFTGVEPPISLKDNPALSEIDDKLRSLKSVIGIK